MASSSSSVIPAPSSPFQPSSSSSSSSSPHPPDHHSPFQAPATSIPSHLSHSSSISSSTNSHSHSYHRNRLDSNQSSEVAANAAVPATTTSSIQSHHSASQSLSLAEVLTRSSGDINKAIDELLNERNKLSSEVAKLSNENIRIWNLMARIRRENEALKQKINTNTNTGTAPTAINTSIITSTAPTAITNTPLPPPPIPQRRVAPTTTEASLTASPTSQSRRLDSITSPGTMSATTAADTTSPLEPIPAIAPQAQSSEATPTASVDVNSRSSHTETNPIHQQRLAARALQQEQSKRRTDPDVGANGNGNGTSHNQDDLNGVSVTSDDDDDYVAVDTDSQLQSSSQDTAHTAANATDDGELHTLPPVQAQEAATPQPTVVTTPQRDRSRTISAARAAAAARQQQNETQRGNTHSRARAESIDSIGSSSQASDLLGIEPRTPQRRKDLAAMGFTNDSSSPSTGPPNSYLLPSTDSMGSFKLKRSPSTLQPREASTRGPVTDTDDPSMPSSTSASASLSLSQAIMAAAMEGPPDATYTAATAQPHLNNHLLRQAKVTVAGSNLQYDDRGREVNSFFLVIELTSGGRTPGSGLTTWKVEKLYSDVLALDAKLKHKHGKSAAKKMSGGNVQLPDKSLFKDHAPSKVDLRKSLLEAYLANLLMIQLPDKDEVCTFLCTDVVPLRPRRTNPLFKEGFLTKKGQNLGRWVTRYYVLEDMKLQHFEGRHGAHLGSINLTGAQIGRQQRSAQSDMDENSYRHAFLILEKRNSDEQLIRHVLCAESDTERDEWVDVLVKCIAEMDAPQQSKGNRQQSQQQQYTPQQQQQSQHSYSQQPHTPRQQSYSQQQGSTPQQDKTRGQPLSPHSRAMKLAGSSATTTTTTTTTRQPPASPTPTPTPKASQQATAAAVPTPLSPPMTKMKRSSSLGRRLRSRDGPGSSSAHGHGNGNGTQTDDHDGLAAGDNSLSAHATGQSAPTAAILPTAAVLPPSSSSSPMPSPSSAPQRSSVRPSISGPMNGTPIPSGYKFGGGSGGSNSGHGHGHGQANSSSTGGGGGGGNMSGSGSQADLQKQEADKKRFWHRFGGGGHSAGGALSPGSAVKGVGVFGVPLTEVVRLEGQEDVPSVVYRCIEYLEGKKSVREEGIYRMSGSTADVKMLRDRFNSEGDVDLIGDESKRSHGYDPHAIASLLKSYLRELPSSILTRDLHLDFMRVTEITDPVQRSNDLWNLILQLPSENYILLKKLCSHLLVVISHAEENKMTMRNVGIVFSPTLGIPAGLFSEFLGCFQRHAQLV
ncbi:unnamed protein product [Sympodiomycopsis kandeliae]